MESILTRIASVAMVLFLTLPCSSALAQTVAPGAATLLTAVAEAMRTINDRAGDCLIVRACPV